MKFLMHVKTAWWKYQKLINRLSRFISASEFIVTADHGFIYKRDSLQESDKVNMNKTSNTYANRRFILSKDAPYIEGSKQLI